MTVFPYKLTSLFLGAVVTLFILFVGPGGYQTVQNWKYIAFLFLFGGYLLILFCWLLFHRMNPMRMLKHSSVIVRLILLYWLFTVISTLLSPYGMYAFWGMTRQEGLLTITIYCGCLIAVSYYGRAGTWLGYLFGGTMTLFGLLCLIQMQGYNPFCLFPAGYSYLDANIAYAGVYLGTVGNADLVAGLLCLAIPIFLLMILLLNERRRWLLMIPLLLCLLVLWQMQVQAGLVGVCLGLFCSLPVMLPLKQRKWAWVILLVVLLLSPCLIILLQPNSGLFYEISQILQGNWDDRFGNGRIYIWRQVIALVDEHLWFGTGPDTMAAAGIPGFDRYSAELNETLSYTVDVAHNEYLNVLYHQGLLAALTFIVALLFTYRKWIAADKSSAVILGSSMLCYCIQAFFGFSMCAVAGLFWLIWGLMLSESADSC